MVHEEHDYSLLIVRQDQTTLGPYAVTNPAAALGSEAAYSLLRRGRAGVAALNAEARVEPVLVDGFVQAIRVIVAGEAVDFPFVDVFGATASAFGRELVRRGTMIAGEIFHYGILATPRAAAAGATGGDDLRRQLNVRVTDAATDVRVLPAAAANLPPVARRRVVDSQYPGNWSPLVIREEVLRQARAMSAARRPEEAVGVLLGRLYRAAPPAADITLAIEALLPVPADSGPYHVNFTDATWRLVHRELRARGDAALLIAGCMHSHAFLHAPPATAAETAETADTTAAAGTPESVLFMSPSDHAAHRVAFPRPYQVALLIADAPAGVACAVYGWHVGDLRRRGYHVLPAGRADTSFPLPLEPQETYHG